jgi:hypothetical protein
VVVTEGGNTSNGSLGSQSNGGGAFRRERRLGDVHGFARVNYPGGRVKTALARLAMRVERPKSLPLMVGDLTVGKPSDKELLKALRDKRAENARRLADEMRGRL